VLLSDSESTCNAILKLIQHLNLFCYEEGRRKQHRPNTRTAALERRSLGLSGPTGGAFPRFERPQGRGILETHRRDTLLRTRVFETLVLRMLCAFEITPLFVVSVVYLSLVFRVRFWRFRSV